MLIISAAQISNLTSGTGLQKAINCVASLTRIMYLGSIYLVSADWMNKLTELKFLLLC